MTTWAASADWWAVLGVSVGLNVTAVAASVGLWRLLVRHRAVAALTRPARRRDVVLTATTTITNAAVLVPAWLAWRSGWIDLASPAPLRFAVDLAYLLIGLDLAMYLLHRLFHADPLYRWFHAWHHTDDDQMSPVTLFVMHPIEAAGFGGITAMLMAGRPVSMAAVGTFFTINLVIGTVAHVPLGTSNSESPTTGWLGGSRLHSGHHRDPRTHFGFFTAVWDRLLGTSSQQTPATTTPAGALSNAPS